MVNHLKALIIQQIREVFANVRVYEESIRQGLQVPAFQILLFDSLSERKLHTNLEKFQSFNVNYYPATENIRTECDTVLELFQNEFKYIGNQFHVNQIQGTISDDVLVITFTVNLLMKEVVVGTKMNELGGVTVDKG